MKRFVLLSTFCLALVFAFSAVAGSTPELRMAKGPHTMAVGAAQTMNAAKQDTVYFLGGPDRLDGKFEDAAGLPDWQGWDYGNRPDKRPGVDRTYNAEHYWSVTDLVDLVIDGTQSLWVGDFFGDPAEPGYGNSWNTAVVFEYEVPDPGVANTVNWEFDVVYDSEPGYDFLFVEYEQAGVWVPALASYNGAGTDYFTAAIEYQPGQYTGDLGNEIKLRLRFASDGSWSDADGLWPTVRGGAQVDNIYVGLGATQISFEDFELVTPSQPGEAFAYGDWVVELAPGVGNFADLYGGLADADECAFNFSPQVAFPNKGQYLAQGLPIRYGTTHTYGPEGGTIVEHSGGLEGAGFGIFNSVFSPVIDFTAGGIPVDGAYMEYDVYRHEGLFPDTVWPGIFYYYETRSINTGVEDDIWDADWISGGFVYYGGPNYLRSRFDLSSFLVPGATHFQVALSCYQTWPDDWTGTDGTPAPYFDNVTVVGYQFQGPSITTRFIDLAQDSFPNQGIVDLIDLSTNAIKFDMANNINPDEMNENRPGDSIFVDVVVVRSGYELKEKPKMHVALKANPLFDAHRDFSGVPRLIDGPTTVGDVIFFTIEGDTSKNTAGIPIEDRWFFDFDGESATNYDDPLPIFFPGDILHYYIEATDIDPISLDEGVSTLPGNIDNFGVFDGVYNYNTAYVVRGLPSVYEESPGVYAQPEILWWNDFDTRGGENEWLNALANIGYHAWGSNPDVVLPNWFDVYYTSGPSSNVGNDLAGRATLQMINGYDTLLYTTGDLTSAVLGNGDVVQNITNDLGLLDNWFLEGGKRAFFTGDDLAYSNAQTAEGLAFNANWLGINYTQRSVRGLILGQITPLVKPVSGNPVFDIDRCWIAYGGCFGINNFDAITAVGAGQKVAGFTAPGDDCDMYTDPFVYAAAVAHDDLTNGNRIVYMPYDFMYIHNAPSGTSNPGVPVPERTWVLQDVMTWFGNLPGEATGVAPDAPLAVSNFPNPFNPATTIKLNLPKSGAVSLKVYNVRGELVRTLVDGALEAGVHEFEWKGTNDRGAQVSSGVYFYETRANGEVKMGKMALVK